ncbi:MAG: DUF4369 domain-containing protein, partial [Sediminibacterium sp.]
MKRTLLIAATLIILASCQDKKFGTFTVSGKIEHAPGKKIMLEELPFGGQQAVVIDSVSLKPNGKFELHGMGKEEGLYRLVLENGPDVLLVNDGKNIIVDLDVNNYRAYKVEGSPASEALHILFEDYRKKDSALLVTFNDLDTLQQQNMPDSVLVVVRAKRDAQIKQMNTMVSDFINQSPSAAARYYALGMASRTMNQDEVLVLVNTSLDKFKDHSGLAKIKTLLTNDQKPVVPKYALMDKQAPEINLPDVDG